MRLTSGTTGPPKGVVQTHGNHLFMVQSCGAIITAEEGDVNLLFLPLAHSFARLEAFLGLYIGLTTAFAESIDALAENMREVRPMLVFSVPRVYEKIYARVQAAGSSGSSFKRALFEWCVAVGRQVSALQQRRQPMPAGLRLRQRLARSWSSKNCTRRSADACDILSLAVPPWPRTVRNFSMPPACSFSKAMG